MKALSPADQKRFTRTMIKWNRGNTREMPWKGEKNPYKVWLSEIILQQTRVEQGRPYYERFVERYPMISSLAEAPEEEVFRLWQGLGYYNRCKHMLAAARLISTERAGCFPDTHADILALPGVGEYTAAAIASFAFGLPHAVVDGNVQRVLARYFGIEADVGSKEGKALFAALAAEVLDRRDPAAYNQAIMDFGATVCTPQRPGCDHCPFRQGCYARIHGLTAALPVKARRAKPRERYFSYFVVRREDSVYVRRRGKGDIWQNLHEFLLRESDTPPPPGVEKGFLKSWSLSPSAAGSPEGPFRQQLTHQVIHASFHEIVVTEVPATLVAAEFFAVKINRLDRLAFPKTILRYLQGRDYVK